MRIFKYFFRVVIVFINKMVELFGVIVALLNFIFGFYGLEGSDGIFSEEFSFRL